MCDAPPPQAGAAVGGPMGAAAGAALGSLIKKPVQGKLRLELRYTPLRAERRDALVRRLEELKVAAPEGAATTPDASSARPEQAASSSLDASLDASDAPSDEEEAAEWKASLATRGLAKGGSEGVDWSTLARRVGTTGTDVNAEFELCCFLTHRESSSETAIWRDRSRRLVVIAFRGTSDIVDVVTDVNFIQTPLEGGFNGQKSDDPRKARVLSIRKRLRKKGKLRDITIASHGVCRPFERESEKGGIR